MKKFLVLATTLVAGLTVGLAQAEEGKEKKGKGGDPAKRAEATIKALDKDKNGTVSKEEFLAGPAATKAKADGKNAEKMFAGRDTNKDGELDKAELSAAPKGKGRPEGGAKPEAKPDSKPEEKPKSE